MTGKQKSKTGKGNKKQKSPSSGHGINSLEDLQREELSGPQDHNASTATSSTDENEDEGLGDGNIGRSKNNILGK